MVHSKTLTAGVEWIPSGANGNRILKKKTKKPPEYLIPNEQARSNGDKEKLPDKDMRNQA